MCTPERRDYTGNRAKSMRWVEANRFKTNSPEYSSDFGHGRASLHGPAAQQ
jgi:hypothetical protein